MAGQPPASSAHPLPPALPLYPPVAPSYETRAPTSLLEAPTLWFTVALDMFVETSGVRRRSDTQAVGSHPNGWRRHA